MSKVQTIKVFTGLRGAKSYFFYLLPIWAFLILGMAGCVGPGGGGKTTVTRVDNGYEHPIPRTKSRTGGGTTTPVVPSNPREEPVMNGTVVIDAGHGGRDPGAPANGVSRMAEKEIVLDIALKTMNELEQEGVNVMATRRNNRFIELEERAAVAERSRADLFVAIHADASKNSSISGVTIYICREASDASRKAAHCIREVFERNGFEVRGIQHGDFKVLVEHSRPAVLVECGYMTNYTDAQRLNSAYYRAKVAEVLAEGILKYFNR